VERLLMTCKIVVNRITASGRHGVLPQERDQDQPFTVDLECVLIHPPADDVLDTVDYAKLVELAQQVISGPHCELLETLAARIAQRCLAAGPLAEITVRVHKPQGPLADQIGDVYAEVTECRIN
jgi:dihydroneopterin aldolase